MKNLLKFGVAGALALGMFVSNGAKAQNSALGIGVTAGWGTHKNAGFAIGGDLKYQFKVGKSLWIPISAGYQSIGWSGDYKDLNIDALQYVPVKAGIKYFFSGTEGLYGEALLGAGIGVNKGDKTYFLYQPAVGYAWDNGLDLQVKYEGLAADGGTSPGLIGLRLAYGFQL